MQHTPAIPDYRAKLNEKAMAKLLGITVAEYQSLSHKPIEAYTDISGNITEFYIHVSTNNDPGLLSKLHRDESNFIRFKPEEVYRNFI